MSGCGDEGFPVGTRDKKEALRLGNAHVPWGCQFHIQEDPFILFLLLGSVFDSLGADMPGEV